MKAEVLVNVVRAYASHFLVVCNAHFDNTKLQILELELCSCLGIFRVLF